MRSERVNNQMYNSWKHQVLANGSIINRYEGYKTILVELFYIPHIVQFIASKLLYGNIVTSVSSIVMDR